MGYRLLLVEDDDLLRASLFDSLSSEFDVVQASTLAEARAAIAAPGAPFTVLLVDLNLPDGDGREVVSWFSSEGDRPIVLMHTGVGEVDEKLDAFSRGVDDYIVKPCDSRELKMRVQARLRQKTKPNSDLSWGAVRLDFDRQQAWVGPAQAPIDLTPIEARLLKVFINHPEQNLDREWLRGEVWGPNVHVSRRVVDTHVSHLRKKLIDSELVFESRPRTGYRMSTAARSRKVG